MKYLELDEQNRYVTFRELNDYRTGCIEVPDDFQEPPDIFKYRLNIDTMSWELIEEPQQNQMAEENIIQQYEQIIDNFINMKAQEKGYDNRITCTMRAGYPSPWQAECIRFALWMDSCYLYCYQALNDVKQGKRPAPTIEQLLEELPKFSWEE
ncbi:MAG: hypothetical protein N2169_07535 [bacterium]|nr:hypothetical protein [bacterium]